MNRGALTAAPIRAPAWLRYVLVLFMGLAAVTLFLLATAAANTQLFAQQYPLLMASLGIEAIKKFAETGEKPKPTEGKDFFDTGVALVTDKPAAGVESIDVKTGTEKCWG